MTRSRRLLNATLPILVVALAAILLWYLLAFWMGPSLLPRPDAVADDMAKSVFGWPVASPRNLLFHAWVTAKAALVGLVVALVLGFVIAIGIVHIRVLDRSLMPWVIASQTIPVLAIAPMVVVVLGNLGFGGLAPKAAISGYLAFFPIVVGMVTGLRAPDVLQTDLMRTYSASERQIFTKLRLPASLAFLFPSLRVSVALSVMGAIVAELPTGAQAGLGARLLAGSYYGHPLMIWSALFMAALLSAALLAATSLVEAGLRHRRGGRL